MRYLLDTNVLSEPSKPRSDDRVIAWLNRHSPLDYAISVLTLGEIANGVALLAPGQQRDRLNDWLDTTLPRQFGGRILSVSPEVARAWGKLTAEGRAAGRALPTIDGLLLATARVHNLTFVTRNERDCAGREVSLLNPWNT